METKRKKKAYGDRTSVMETRRRLWQQNVVFGRKVSLNGNKTSFWKKSNVAGKKEQNTYGNKK
jgi:hypothetical protein